MSGPSILGHLSLYALAIALAVSTTGCGIKGPLQSAKEAPTPATKPAKPAPPEKL